MPHEDVAIRRRGRINRSGWTISYLFGSDDKGNYLDFYAAHRMTNDQHLRIYEDGDEEPLPAIQDIYFGSEDPEEDKKRQAEFFAENQRIARLLDEKGFGDSGVKRPPSN